MIKISLCMILLALIVCSSALYEGKTAVEVLTSTTFAKTKKGIWLVEFFADWCGHCKQLAPEYEKAAAALKGIAHIAAIDASKESTGIQIQGYPTIKLFVDGVPTDYNGGRNAQGFVDFMLDYFKTTARKRLGGGSSGGTGGSSEKDSDDDVIVLTDENFDKLVYGDDKAWFVKFYAPWCGHCKSLAPVWAQLATNLKGQVQIAKLDATAHTQAAAKFGVKGYPSLKFFPAGVKNADSAVDYDGARGLQELTQWTRQQTGGKKVFTHTKLSSQSVYDKNCKGKEICIVAFLPHILDSSETEREGYLEKIKDVGLKFRGKPFKFLWAQGSDHYEVEESLGISGLGYPVLTFLYESKKIQGKMRGAFSDANIDNFITEILGNKAKVTKLPSLPQFVTVPEEDPTAQL